LGPYTFTVRQPSTQISLVPNGTDAIGDGIAGATVTLDFNATATLYATHSGRWIFKDYWGGQRMTIPGISSDPASPVDGQFWRRSDTDLFYLRKNSGTVQVATINAAGSMVIGGGAKLSSGSSSPEASLTGNPGDIYLRNNAGTGELWLKISGTGNTGWTLK
jgi:hypothetical protein